MHSNLLHVVTAVSNPLRWGSRINLARRAINAWVRDGANVTVVECAYGERDYDLADIPGITHIPVRAHTVAWNKECLLNIGINRLPHGAKYIALLDADIHFRKASWAAETVHTLQLYPIIQPWATAYDLGPHDEHLQSHTSFCRLFAEGKPSVAQGKNWWRFDGGPYEYAHTGFAWAYTRRALEDLGGILDICAMGSADHHMALGLVGQAEKSMPSGTDQTYKDTILRWQNRALHHINRKLGFVPVTIEHQFHGRKQDRGYITRWNMFVNNNFDPITDLKKNSFGVWEFAGNKPDLEREFMMYLRSRDEDIGSC